MISVYSYVQDILDDNFIVLKSEDNLKEKIVSNQPRASFLIRNHNEIYKTVFFENSNQVIYIPCVEIEPNMKIKNLLYQISEQVCFIVKDSNEKIVGFIDFKTVILKLFQSKEMLKSYISTILDTVNEAITVINKDKEVVAWSEQAEKMFSITKNDIVREQITDYFFRENLEILSALLEGTSVRNHQHQATDKLIVLINSNPVLYNNKIIGAVASETDITSQIKLNQALYHKSQNLLKYEKQIRKLKPNEDPNNQIIGNSKALESVKKDMQKAASTSTNILIYGESGVGKELFAKAIHQFRENDDAPFIAINCGAISPSLFESEIFGYEKGAFSGASESGKKGLVGLANGGTLFLDEIGEMPLDMQVKLLRLIETRKYFPVGGEKELKTNFRLVAATNRDLKKLTKAGKFRQDLYYRLNVINITIPPLRERTEDIIELTHYFLHEMSIKYNKPIHGISQSIMNALLNYHWPGNIRELKNVIERLIIFSEDGNIKIEDLPFESSHVGTFSSEVDNQSLNERLALLEKDIILQELKKVDGNKLLCAKNLQITRGTLYNRLKKLGID